MELVSFTEAGVDVEELHIVLNIPLHEVTEVLTEILCILVQVKGRSTKKTISVCGYLHPLHGVGFEPGIEAFVVDLERELSEVFPLSTPPQRLRQLTRDSGL